MKLFEPLSFRRIFLTIFSAVVVGFVGISIRYFGFTYLGKQDMRDIADYDDQIEWHKDDYDHYKNLPLLSGFDRNMISTREQSTFTLPFTESNTYTNSQTMEEITNHGGMVKISMDEMIGHNMTGFIVKLDQPLSGGYFSFQIYRIADTYAPKTYFSLIRQYFSTITGITRFSKSDFIVAPYLSAYLQENGGYSSSCIQFVNNDVIQNRLMTSTLESDCMLFFYDAYGYYDYFREKISTYDPYMQIRYSSRSDEPLSFSIQKMQ